MQNLFECINAFLYVHESHDKEHDKHRNRNSPSKSNQFVEQGDPYKTGNHRKGSRHSVSARTEFIPRRGSMMELPSPMFKTLKEKQRYYLKQYMDFSTKYRFE